MVEMEENTELEEGEAGYSKDDNEATVDINSYCYIDERVENILGDLQKEFEDDLSTENLGPKFGGYGTFLHTYERTSCVRSDPRTLRENHSSPKSNINLRTEAVSHNTKVPSNVPALARLENAFHISPPSRDLRAASVNDSVKKEQGVSSSDIAERCTWKNDTSKKTGNSTDQRTLKFRIKMKSNILEQKKAEIYSGLGLDISPSPSPSSGNSPVESEGMPPVTQENAEDSPTAIIQVMTSLPIHGGVLISPLHQSLLCLTKNEKVFGDRRFSSSRNSHQDTCSMSTDESDSVAEDGLLKKSTVRIGRQSEKQLELKHMNGFLSEKDMMLHAKKRLGNRTPDHLSNELKWTPLSSSICDAAEFTAKASEASKEVNENGVQGRMVSVEVLKEESLESISGQDFDKTEKQNARNGFMKKAFEHMLKNSNKDNSMDPKNKAECDTSMISNKAGCDAVKCKVDHKYETHQKVKVVSGWKNKSKGEDSPGKAEADARKDSFGSMSNAMVIDKGTAGIDNTYRRKMTKSKSLKDNKSCDSNRDSLKEKISERKVDSLAGNGAIKNANISNGKQSAFGTKVKERPSGHKVVNQLPDGPRIKDTSGSLPITQNNLAPEMISSAGSAQHFIEDWVGCDSCHKWRLLPYGMKPVHLPEKWLCSMLNWLPGKNSCDISEDETTKALRDLYQMPISEGQNNMQIHGTDTAIGVSSTDTLQYGLNHKMPSSDMLSGRGKKHIVKEKTMPGINNGVPQFSNSAKTNVKVSENRSLNQHSGDLNLMKKMSSSKHLSKLDNMIEEKHVPKDKEKQVNGGDRKVVLKRKMDADQYKSGNPKKPKTKQVCYADKQQNPGIGHEKVALYSGNGLPTKAGGKVMRKYDEYFLSEDVQDRLPVSVKKEGHQAQVSSDGGSMDVKNSSKSASLMKKRKLKDRLDDEKPNNSYSLHGEKQYGEESNGNEFRKEKKYRIMNKEAKSVTEGGDKLSKGGMRQACLSGSRDQMAGDTEVRFVGKVNQTRKHRKNIGSLHASDGIDQLGKEFGSGSFSMVATSSSSKVSGSHIAKTNFEDVRGSPVESVTSSPLRASNLGKKKLAGDTSVKDDATKGCLSSVDSRRSVDKKEEKLSVKLKGGRILNGLHPASHKLSSTEYQDEDDKDRARVLAIKSSELKNNHLHEGNFHLEPGYRANHIHHEEKVNNDNQESELSWHKSGKVTSLHSKEKERKSGSHVGTDKMKISVSETGYSRESGRYDSAVDPSNHAYGTETKNNAKYTSQKSKCEIDSVSQKSALRYGPNETAKQTEPKQRGFANPVPKMDAQCSTDRKTISKQNLTWDVEEENKANHVSRESRVGKSKVLSSAVDEVKKETLNVGSRTVAQYQKGAMSNEHPVHVSGNGNLAKSMTNYVDASNNAGVDYTSGNFAPKQQPSMSNPLRTNSNQTAVDTLEEAAKLKDRADNYKNSGFDFESNETYFQAGLKFLHGASLLENCHNESSKHGEMSQMQYSATAAKLFKCCAHEYETRQEVAAAALAYKCMEVAYMRVVYYKNSSTNRDRHELQSTLQMVSQGESPSSSASDVDNLNNQAAVDKATLPKGTNTHTAMNQVISAQTRPNLLRLLDFTQDISFAMEASIKCQRTFAAANAILEEERNKYCIASIRSVIDFSFQDVDEFLHLVWTATKAISCAGLGGARD